MNRKMSSITAQMARMRRSRASSQASLSRSAERRSRTLERKMRGELKRNRSISAIESRRNARKLDQVYNYKFQRAVVTI